MSYCPEGSQYYLIIVHYRESHMSILCTSWYNGENQLVSRIFHVSVQSRFIRFYAPHYEVAGGIMFSGCPSVRPVLVIALQTSQPFRFIFLFQIFHFCLLFSTKTKIIYWWRNTIMRKWKLRSPQCFTVYYVQCTSTVRVLYVRRVIEVIASTELRWSRRQFPDKRQWSILTIISNWQ